MIRNNNIDLTTQGDFSKANPLIVKVKNGIMNHPRIPWKIMVNKSLLKKFYSYDANYYYRYSTNTYSLLDSTSLLLNSYYNSNANTFYISSNMNNFFTGTTDFVYDIDQDSLYRKDIFGLPHINILTKGNRIPYELSKDNVRSISIHGKKWNRLPSTFNNTNINYYYIPEEFFKPNYYKDTLLEDNENKIPWKNKQNKYIRVGKRKSERGIVLFYD